MKSDLTCTRQEGVHLSDAGVATDLLQVPAEEHFLCQSHAGVQGQDVAFIQRNIPNVEVGDIPKEGLGEIPSEGILILAQNEYPVPKNVPGGVWARARVPPAPVHVDGPAAAAAAPRDADVMPPPVVAEGGLVGEVLPVDDEGQEDTSLDVQLAPKLELVGEDGRSVGEDGGHLIPVPVPLDAETDADGGQVRQRHVDTGEGLAGPHGEG